MLNIEHSEHKVDATHARINVGKFCYKLLVREIAGITQWNETVDIKHHNEQATNQLNAHLKATIKINTCLKCYYDQNSMSRFTLLWVPYGLLDLAVPANVSEIKLRPRKVKILGLKKCYFRVRHYGFAFR